MSEGIMNMVEEEVADVPMEEEVEVIPSSTDPKWVEYVIDQLADHELVNGSPTTDGLRRVTEKIYGTILYSDTEVLEIPKVGSSARTTAKHKIAVERYSDSRHVEVSACVDVLADKLPYPFNQHLVSTACTRAEGKALRRLLKIRVQTAEEMANADDDTSEMNNDDINDQQILAIKTMCKRVDVDLVKLVKTVSAKAKSIRDVKNIEGRLIMTKLSEMQRDGVPDGLSGYKNNWEEKFGGKSK